MKWSKWFDKWEMNSLNISARFLDREWNPAEPDGDAAWELDNLMIAIVTRRTRWYIIKVINSNVISWAGWP